jgi:hypothetical protein
MGSTYDSFANVININENVHLHFHPLQWWCIRWNYLFCVSIKFQPIILNKMHFILCLWHWIKDYLGVFMRLEVKMCKISFMCLTLGCAM